MKIGYNDKINKFTIACPVWANDVVMTLTTRSWSKATRQWYVPIVRENVDRLRVIAKMAGVEVDGEARSALDSYDTIRKQRAKATKSGFPAWYKFKREPRKHQVGALQKLYGLHAGALFMDMQTGKSKTVVDLTAAHRMEGHVYGGIVFTKLTLRMNWIHHFERDCPIPFSIHLPLTDKHKQFERWLHAKHDFKIMVVGWESLSQGSMHELCRQFMRSIAHPFCAGDETTYIANYKSERSKRAVEISHMADYRYALTGTPALEGPMNLFMQFEFLDPDIIGIGDFLAYRNRYAVMGGFHKEIRGVKTPVQIVGYTNLEELTKTISPHIWQVTKTDAYDLPPKRYQQRTVELTKLQYDLMDKIKKDGVLAVKGAPDHVMKTVLEVALRLHQVAGGYTVKPREERRTKLDGTEVVKTVFDPVELIKPDKNPKMIELIDVLESFKGKKQGLIWVVYRPELEAICKIAKSMGFTFGQLHGGVPERERQPMVDEYERGGLDLIIGNASTGGMGYTMQASEVNVFYNNTHKAIDRVQAEDRGYGDGQTKSAVWVDIVADRSVDVTILASLQEKKDLSEYLRERIAEAIELLSMDALNLKGF